MRTIIRKNFKFIAGEGLAKKLEFREIKKIFEQYNTKGALASIDVYSLIHIELINSQLTIELRSENNKELDKDLLIFSERIKKTEKVILFNSNVTPKLYLKKITSGIEVTLDLYV